MDNGCPVIVMSRLPGDSLGASPLTPNQVAAVGEAMGTMYRAVPQEHLDELTDRISGPAEMIGELRSWCRQPHNSQSALVQRALTVGSRWVEDPDVDALMCPTADRVFTQGDGNLGNLIWDGLRCSVVDFEDSGISDPAYEVADLLEHVSVWLRDLIDEDQLVAHLGFSPAQLGRLTQFRRLMALFWLLMLLPGNRGHTRNPPGSDERQAQRLLDLLA